MGQSSQGYQPSSTGTWDGSATSMPMNQQQPYQGWYSQSQQPPQQQTQPLQQTQQPQSPMGMGMGAMGGSGKPSGGMGVPMNWGGNPLMTNQISGGNPLMMSPGMNGSNPLQRNPGGLIPGYGPTEQSVTMNTNPMNNMNYAQNAFLGGMPGAGQILDQRYQAAYGPGGYAGPWTANG